MNLKEKTVRNGRYGFLMEGFKCVGRVRVLLCTCVYVYVRVQVCVACTWYVTLGLFLKFLI